MADKHVTGPIQVFVVGFDKFEATGRILAELRRVRKRGVIRIVDVIFVQKNRHGDIENSMHLTDLSETERMRLGSIAGALIGLRAGGIEGEVAGAELGALAVAERDAGLGVDRMQELAESIPAGGAAAILVIEHHWAASLRDAIADAGGRALMQAMIAPDALALVGDELRAKMEAEDAIEAAEAIKLAAAMEIAQTLVEAELIEEAAIAEAADVVATALAIEDAAAEDVVDTLFAAELIEESAKEEAQNVVRMSLDVEEAATEEAEDAVATADQIEAEAALRAVRALMAADLIEREAAKEAVDALVAAEHDRAGSRGRGARFRACGRAGAGRGELSSRSGPELGRAHTPTKGDSQVTDNKQNAPATPDQPVNVAVGAVSDDLGVEAVGGVAVQGNQAIVVAQFADMDSAKNAYYALVEAEVNRAIDIDGVLVANADYQGKVHIQKMTDHKTRNGFLWGAVGGAVIGLIFPPTIIAGAVSVGVAGAAIGKARNVIMKSDVADELASVIAPGTSGIVALVSITAVDAVKQTIPDAKVVKSAPVSDETAAAVKQAASAAGDQAAG